MHHIFLAKYMWLFFTLKVCAPPWELWRCLRQQYHRHLSDKILLLCLILFVHIFSSHSSCFSYTASGAQNLMCSFLTFPVTSYKRGTPSGLFCESQNSAPNLWQYFLQKTRHKRRKYQPNTLKIKLSANTAKS